MSPFAQLLGVGRMALQSIVNSVRRRQGSGAMAVLPLLVVFLTIELARFGSRASIGVQRVLGRVSPERGVQYAAFWTLVLFVAITALKYARMIPGRGARSMFDTTLFRALPVSATTRVVCELLVGSSYAAGFVALVWIPTVWGVFVFAHPTDLPVGKTALVALVANGLATLVAYALHVGISRRLGARALDGMRVLAALTGVGLVGGFIAQGPIAASMARVLLVSNAVPWWSRYEPTWSFAAWALGLGGTHALAETLGLSGALAAAALGVIAWRNRLPTDLSLDTPPESVAAGRWRAALSPWWVECTMLLRQGPYLPFAAPAFLVFFVALVRSARRATGSDMPWIALFGLVAWALLVLGTALSGAASRRWRRALWLPGVAGTDLRVVVRAVAIANTAMTALLALTPLAVLLQPRQPAWWWYPRQCLGLLAAIAVTQWLQSAAVFSMIDPAPDRLTGLSVGATFLVVAASMPGAAMTVTLSAFPLTTWLPLLLLYALYAWSLERTAIERLRWIREPDEDPLAPRRSWPALRTFLIALMAQVVVMTFAEQVVHLSTPATLVLGYLPFAAVLIPSGFKALVREDLWRTPSWRWALAGIALGGLNFALASLYARVAVRFWGPTPGPLTHALRSADGPTRVALVLIAALLGPLSEELFFRAWLQQSLKLDLPPRLVRASFLVAAVVFSGMHAAEGWATSLFAGVVMGLLMERSRRIEASVAMHITTNSLVMWSALHG